jgi:hypothetical protein
MAWQGRVLAVYRQIDAIHTFSYIVWCVCLTAVHLYQLAISKNLPIPLSG